MKIKKIKVKIQAVKHKEQFKDNLKFSIKYSNKKRIIIFVLQVMGKLLLKINLFLIHSVKNLKIFNLINFQNNCN